MTDQEKNELKMMLDMGYITQEQYDFELQANGVAPQPAPAQDVGAWSARPSIDMPTPPQEPAEWHIVVNNQPSGPFNKSTLKDMLVAGQMTGDSNVWKKGMAAWVKASTVAELEDILSELPPPFMPVAAPVVAEPPSVAAHNFKSRYEEAWALFDAKRYDEAFPLFKALAEEGYAPAQDRLSICYYWGYGVAQDHAKMAEWFLKAMELWRKAAEQGDAEAQVSLGIAYLDHRVKLNDADAKAMEWFHKAAEQGNRDAMCNIGHAYYYGDECVAQDYTKAAEWFRKAAAKGNEYAQEMLDDMKKEGKI